MGLLEDVLALDAQPDQGVDVEEAAISQLLHRGLPIGEAIVLLIEKIVEAVEVRIQLRDGTVDRFADVRLFRAKPLEQAVEHGLVAMPREDQPAIPELGYRQAAVGGREKVQGVGLGILRGANQNRGQRQGRDGKLLSGGLDLKGISAAQNLDAASLQDAAVLVGEDRHQNLVAQTLLLRLPVDVEEGGVAARGSVLQHVPPVLVFTRRATCDWARCRGPGRGRSRGAARRSADAPPRLPAPR